MSQKYIIKCLNSHISEGSIFCVLIHQEYASKYFNHLQNIDISYNFGNLNLFRLINE